MFVHVGPCQGSQQEAFYLEFGNTGITGGLEIKVRYSKISQAILEEFM